MLPPVSTEGLTAADVGDLAVRVHQQMLETLREISDPNAPPPPDAASEFFTLSQTTKDISVDTPSTPKESTPVPSTPDVSVSDFSEERPVSPHSEVTSEGSIRRSENETEEEEGMVLVGRPR
jgi:lysophosphatidate acyltransferase